MTRPLRSTFVTKDSSLLRAGPPAHHCDGTQSLAVSAAWEVAVGTALAGGPPRRSQRAGLPHWAPALGGGGEAHIWEGVSYAGGWEPSVRQAVHPRPVEPDTLAAAPERLEPVPGELGAEGR